MNKKIQYFIGFCFIMIILFVYFLITYAVWGNIVIFFIGIDKNLTEINISLKVIASSTQILYKEQIFTENVFGPFPILSIKSEKK